MSHDHLSTYALRERLRALPERRRRDEVRDLVAALLWPLAIVPPVLAWWWLHGIGFGS